MPAWYCYRGNGEHTGCISGKGSTNGSLSWTYSVEENVNVTALVILDNILYFTTGVKIHALDALSGNLLWEKDFSEKIYDPAIVNDTIYIGSENGIIYSLDGKSGNEKWSYKIDNSIRNSPAIIRDNLFVGSIDGKLYNIDISSGNLKWFFNSGEAIESSPVVFDNIVFFCGGKILYAIDVNSGKERWSYTTRMNIKSCPSISNGVIYFSSGYIYALDVINGSRKWITEIEGYEITDTITASNGAVFVPSTVYMSELDKKAGVIYCIDGRTGNREWAFFSWNSVSLPAIVEHYIYFGSGDGKMYALDGRNGLLKWSCELGDLSFIPPVGGNGYVYIAGDRGKIYAFK